MKLPGRSRSSRRITSSCVFVLPGDFDGADPHDRDGVSHVGRPGFEIDAQGSMPASKSPICRSYCL